MPLMASSITSKVKDAFTKFNRIGNTLVHQYVHFFLMKLLETIASFFDPILSYPYSSYKCRSEFSWDKKAVD